MDIVMISNRVVAPPAGMSGLRFRRNEPRALYTSTLFLLALILLLSSATGFAASLVVDDAAAPAIADLTVTGTTDWIHWGLTSASSINRKAGVTPRLNSFTIDGGIARRYNADVSRRQARRWSDGTPTASATTTTGIFLRGIGNRYELSVPADTTSKTLTLYAGGWRARGQLDVRLSDGSASPGSITIDNPSGVIDREVAISFAAASAGQSLLITYTLLDDYDVGGNITLAGAALAETGNQPPTLAPIGDQVITAGQLLSFTVLATDPDGPAPLILTGSPLPVGAAFHDNNDGSGQFDWAPSESDVTGSPYLITFTATDGAGLSRAETIQIVVNSSTGGSGSLVIDDAAAPAIADLTVTGTTDWIHWGLTSASSINRKAGVTPRLNSFTINGGIAKRYNANVGVRVDYTWSDGTPTASATTTTGIFLRGIGNRYELSVPADTTSKTLTLYAGGWRARGQLDVRLSDGSASPGSITIDNPSGVIDREVAISFAAASAGQSLLITYTLLDDYDVGGNITLAGAALAETGNQPPTLAPIGDQVITAGQLLSFTVLATDPDGPAPLILTGSPLPVGAAFHDNNDGSGQFDWAPSESDVTGSPYLITFTATDGAGLFASTTIDITVRSIATRPNIVLITTDDLGYGDLGSYGSSTIATPNLDQLAADGLRFTDFYAAPVCQMARTQLMTGSYSPRVGMSPGMLPLSNFGINSSELTIAELLKTNGYATAIFGKWHLGDAPEFLPTQNGFDKFFGVPYSNDMWPFHPKICETPNEDPRLTAARERAILTGFAGENTPCWPVDFFPDLPLIADNQVVELNSEQSTFRTRFTQDALDFIRQNADQPFFLYLPYTAPHVPLFPDSAFIGSSLADLYGDTVQELDFRIGLILNELDDLGLVNNTLVIFVSDNGPWLQYGIDGGNAGPLRSGKGTVFEGGVRVPAIMKWPAEIPPGSQSQAIAGLVDIYSTIASSAGVAVPQDRVIDGKDLTPVLRDPAVSTGPRSELYFFREAPNREVDQTLYLRAMRSGQWKLHIEMSGTTVVANALYNLETDIGESNNLIGSNPIIVQGLTALAQTFNDTLRQNTRPVGIKTTTGGSLVIDDAAAPAIADLTVTGTTDWIHWGLTSASSINRKAGVTPRLNSFTINGGIAKRYNANVGVRVDYTWSDGTPTASATTTTGIFLRGIGNRYELSVPADTTSKTLTLYAGGWRARGQLDVRLSDGSASPGSITIDNPSGVIDREVAISFAAASAGQSLLITYTLLDDYDVGGNITLAGAALGGD